MAKPKNDGHVPYFCNSSSLFSSPRATLKNLLYSGLKIRGVHRNLKTHKKYIHTSNIENVFYDTTVSDVKFVSDVTLSVSATEDGEKVLRI